MSKSNSADQFQDIKTLEQEVANLAKEAKTKAEAAQTAQKTATDAAKTATDAAKTATEAAKKAQDALTLANTKAEAAKKAQNNLTQALKDNKELFLEKAKKKIGEKAAKLKDEKDKEVYGKKNNFINLFIANNHKNLFDVEENGIILDYKALQQKLVDFNQSLKNPSKSQASQVNYKQAFKTYVEEDLKKELTDASKVDPTLFSNNWAEVKKDAETQSNSLDSKNPFSDLEKDLELWKNAKVYNDEFNELKSSLKNNEFNQESSIKKIEDFKKKLAAFKESKKLDSAVENTLAKKIAGDVDVKTVFLAECIKVNNDIKKSLEDAVKKESVKIADLVDIAGKKSSDIFNKFVKTDLEGKTEAEKIIEDVSGDIDVKYNAKNEGHEAIGEAIFKKIAESQRKINLSAIVPDLNKAKVASGFFKSQYKVLAGENNTILLGDALTNAAKTIPVWINPASKPGFFPVFKGVIDSILQDGGKLSEAEKNFLDKFAKIEIFASEEQKNAIKNILGAFTKGKEVTHANLAMGMGGGKTQILKAIAELTANFSSNLDDAWAKDIGEFKSQIPKDSPLKEIFGNFEYKKEADVYKVNLAPALGKKKITVGFEYGKFSDFLNSKATDEKVSEYIITEIVKAIAKENPEENNQQSFFGKFFGKKQNNKSDLLIALDEFDALESFRFKNANNKELDVYSLVKDSLEKIKSKDFKIIGKTDKEIENIKNKISKVVSIKSTGTLNYRFASTTKLFKLQTASVAKDKEELKANLGKDAAILKGFVDEYKKITEAEQNSATLSNQKSLRLFGSDASTQKNVATKAATIIIDHDLPNLYDCGFILPGGNYKYVEVQDIENVDEKDSNKFTVQSFLPEEGQTVKLVSVENSSDKKGQEVAIKAKDLESDIKTKLNTLDPQNKKLNNIIEGGLESYYKKINQSEKTKDRARVNQFLSKEFVNGEGSIICFVAKEYENNEIREKYHLFKMENGEIVPVVNKIDIEGNKVDRLFFTDDQLKEYVAKDGANQKIKVVYTQDVARGGNYPVNGGVFANDAMMEIRNFDLNSGADRIVSELLQNLKRNRGKQDLKNLKILDKDDREITQDVFKAVEGYKEYIEFMTNDESVGPSSEGFKKACIDNIKYIDESSNTLNNPRYDRDEVIKIARLIKEGTLTDQNLKALSGNKDNAEAFKKFERNFSAASQIAKMLKCNQLDDVKEIKEITEEIATNTNKIVQEKQIKVNFLGEKEDGYKENSYKLNAEGVLEIDYKKVEESLLSKVDAFKVDLKLSKDKPTDFIAKYIEKTETNATNIFYDNVDIYIGNYFEDDDRKKASNLFFKKDDKIYFDNKLYNESINGSEGKYYNEKSFNTFNEGLTKILTNIEKSSLKDEFLGMKAKIEAAQESIKNGNEFEKDGNEFKKARNRSVLLQLAKDCSVKIGKAVSSASENLKAQNDYLGKLISDKWAIEELKSKIDSKNTLSEADFNGIFEDVSAQSEAVNKIFTDIKSKKLEVEKIETILGLLKVAGQMSKVKEISEKINLLDNTYYKKTLSIKEEDIKQDDIPELIKYFESASQSFNANIESEENSIKGFLDKLDAKNNDIQLKITTTEEKINKINNESGQEENVKEGGVIEEIKDNNDYLINLMENISVFNKEDLLPKEGLEGFKKAIFGESKLDNRDSQEIILNRNAKVDENLSNLVKNKFVSILGLDYQEKNNEFSLDFIKTNPAIDKPVDEVVNDNKLEQYYFPIQDFKIDQINPLKKQEKQVDIEVKVPEQISRTFTEKSGLENFQGKNLKGFSYKGSLAQDYGTIYFLENEIESVKDMKSQIISTKDTIENKVGQIHLVHSSDNKQSKSFSVRYNQNNSLEFFAINIIQEKMKELAGSCFLRVSADKYIKINIDAEGGFSIQKTTDKTTDESAVQLYNAKEGRDILFTKTPSNQNFSLLKYDENKKALGGGVTGILKNLEIRVQTPYSAADKKSTYERKIIQAIGGEGNDNDKGKPNKTFTKTGPSNKFVLSSKTGFKQLNDNQTKTK